MSGAASNPGGPDPRKADSRDARIADRLELLVESYLLGELEGEQLAGFERDLAGSEELRRQVDMQRQVEASLRRLYVAPQPAASDVISREWPTLAEQAARRRRPLLARRITWLSAAAAILLGVGIWSWIPREHVTPLAPGELYTIMRGRGFVPEFVCTTDDAFAKLIRDRFGQGLAPTHAVGVEMLGWGYSSDYYGSPLSKNALVLLARSEGEPVVVVMDRLSEDRTLQAPRTCSQRAEGSGKPPLNMYRTVMGKLVLYEITPRPEPEVTRSLRIAE